MKIRVKNKWKRTFMNLLGVITCASCASVYVDQRVRSDHFREGEFRNISPHEEKGFWEVLKLVLFEDFAEWPDKRERREGTTPIAGQPDGKIRVTHILHSTVLIQVGEYNILTDPIYSERCSPVSFLGPKRVHEPGIAFEDLPKIDIVIISHDHYDHLDLPTIEKLVIRDSPKIFLGLGVGRHLDSMKNVTEMDWWETVQVGPKFELSFVPVQHFSGRGLFDRNETLWGGYVLEVEGKRIYFGGDTGYAEHFQSTYQEFGEMDLALLPIGAYAPRDFMGPVHMDPRQAVQAHLDLQSRMSIGIHYGTFRLTAEPIDEPIRLLAEELAKAGLGKHDFIAAEFGQPIVLSDDKQKNILAKNKK